MKKYNKIITFKEEVINKDKRRVNELNSEISELEKRIKRINYNLDEIQEVSLYKWIKSDKPLETIEERIGHRTCNETIKLEKREDHTKISIIHGSMEIFAVYSIQGYKHGCCIYEDEKNAIKLLNTFLHEEVFECK